MNRRDFVKTLGVSIGPLLLSGCFNQQNSTNSQRPPNVILVITDDQGYGDLGCHGNPVVQTPHLDQLYQRSVRLTNFHVGPTCAPTRASLMTGHYCNRTGVWHTVMGRSLLREDELTLGNLFQMNGYQTAIFGKWHLGDAYPFNPQFRGFTEAIVHGGGGVGQMPDYWENDYFDDTYWHNGVPQKYNGYCTDVWFNEAIRFIERNQESPFFCYLSTNAPHGPFHVPEKYSQPYLEQGIPAARARFYGMITNIDENMARLLQKIETTGLAENTILIYLTDNGTSAGVDVDENGFPTRGFNAGMRGKKGSEYDGGHRVPCFFHWSGGELNQGRDINQLTAHIDLMPTLIDLCQLTTPDNLDLDGNNLTPLLQEKSLSWPERILITDSQRLEYPQKWRKSAVMTNRWRLINGTELYDLTIDPGQRTDVAADYPAVVAQLREAYEQWWAHVSPRFDEYCEIVVGSEQVNPVALTTHDWHEVELPDHAEIQQKGGEVNPPWNQTQVRSGMVANGFWALRITRSGCYEITLCRWPREINQPINAGLPAGGPIPGGVPFPPGKALHFCRARIKIGEIDLEKTIKANETGVVFQTHLEAGPTRLKTWFISENGISMGAYYVYIKMFQVVAKGSC